MLYYTVRMLESIEGRQGSVSSWLHKVRTRLDLSQHDLARILGVHWVTVSRWENGHNEPKMSQLSRLALFFLKEALDPWRLMGLGASFQSGVVSHAVAYELPGVGPAVGRYVAAGLRRGFRVFFVFPGDGDRDGLLRWLGLPAGVVGRRGVDFLPTREVFFRHGMFDITHMSWHLRGIAEEASRAGYLRILWVCDMRPLLSWGVGRRELVSLEYVTDAVFRCQDRSRGLSVHVAPGEELLLDACILCRHPWILAPGGLIRNPYYNDPLLCRARGYLGGELNAGFSPPGRGLAEGVGFEPTEH
ncbi:MAG: hypothetical protein XD60_0474 [Acetothermia bacterium 64_32]|nr:MAG: hypothetical protein XD60_0474 [Acetothermia bacterium 64_32]